MYALPNKTQHKLIAKVRGGINQKLDTLSANSSSSSSSQASQSQSSSSSTLQSSFNTGFANKDFSSSQTGSSSSASSLFRSSTATLLSKEATLNRHIDEVGFNADLNCLPQPVFQHGNKQKSASHRAQKKYITPEHNEMIKYVQQSWKGVERDYKKSVNNYINNIDINGSTTTTSSTATTSSSLNDHHLKQKQGVHAKKKTATTSTPLLLTGSYHHTSTVTKDSTGSARQDSFRPFDLETFWGNRILKRLTQDL